MDLSTYSGLRDAIADYIARDDLTMQIPGFIRLAEVKFARLLRTLDLEQVASLTAAADGTVTLPVDFEEIRSLASTGAVGRGLEYLPRDIALIRNGRGWSGSAYGYAIAGLTLLVAPAGAVAVRLIYQAKFIPLSNTVATNWLLQRSPDAYLYGALAEYDLFSQPDQPSRYGAKCGAALDELVSADKRRRFAGGRMRHRGPNP